MGQSTQDVFVAEAREILDALTSGLLALDRGDATAPVIDELFRRAHTLKGAARIVRQPAIAEMAHLMEDVLAGHRDSGEPVSAQEIGELLQLVDALEAQLASVLAAAAPAPSRSAAAPAEDEPATVRVDVAVLDAIVAMLIDIEAQVVGLREDERELEWARRRAKALADPIGAATSARAEGAEQLRAALGALARRTGTRIDAVERGVRRLRAETDALRLIPVGDIFAPLERAVRDAARELGRRVDFTATGGEIRLDRNVLHAARDALLHLVRNAAGHGIEPSDVRERAGKPACGRVALRAERRGDRVVFSCEDDGRGIDVAAVRRAAVARGVLSAADADALDDVAALDLIFAAGVSTASAVSELSGRGVGLDVVRAAAARFHGRTIVDNRPGLGVTISLDLPVSLASFVALAVEADGRRALIPIDAVAGTQRVSDADLVRSPRGLAVLHEGEIVPFVPLALLLVGAVPERARPAWSAAVIRTAAGTVALGVDRLRGAREVAMHPLPAALGRFPILAGAAIEEGGDPILVLDPEGTAQAALARAGAGIALAASAPRKPSILVIDDSITTRMLEQSMLEAAGYEVELAASAEEGLTKAAARPHALIIVDVEMPGMNGFEFVETARRDPALRATPIILLSSLSSPAHRERGARAGANAYLCKGEFDQVVFLRRVEELTR